MTKFTHIRLNHASIKNIYAYVCIYILNQNQTKTGNLWKEWGNKEKEQTPGKQNKLDKSRFFMLSERRITQKNA